MAHFRTEIKGNRGWAHRTGTKDSGMEARVHGWDFGLRVEIHHDPTTNNGEGEDFCKVYRTDGAKGDKRDEFLFEVTADEIFSGD